MGVGIWSRTITVTAVTAVPRAEAELEGNPTLASDRSYPVEHLLQREAATVNVTAVG